MQTPDFNLKPLRTLGIFLACGALAVGCAGNSVKPMSQDTGAVTSSAVSNAPVTTSDAKPVEQTPTGSATTIADKATRPTADNVDTASASDDNAMNTAPTIANNQDTTQTAEASQEPTQTTFYFGMNKATLNDQDKAVLEEHARFLKANPDLTLEINGHTDSSGPLAYNKYLSKQRAEAVAKILINDGVTSSQLVINAMADTKPLPVQNDPGKNRRVELQYDDMSMVSTK